MSTSHPIFQDNQVLTSQQLNFLRDYLDEQVRLTRAKLIGIGVTNGLHVDSNYDAVADTLSEIYISCGAAVSSEGYLMTLGQCTINRYRDYTLPLGQVYEPFTGNDATLDITLYELLTPTATTLPSDTVTLLSDNPGSFYADKVVLLFVEFFDMEKDSCLGGKCEEFGISRTYTLRKLMLSKAHADIVLSRAPGILFDPLFPAKYGLDDIIMRRTLFDPNLPHSNNYTDFSLNYATTFRSDIFVDMIQLLKDTYTVYKPLLEEHYNSNNPFDDPAINTLVGTWTNFLNGSSTGPAYLGIQYFYDFVKDLILAYNEFCDVAFELASECCVNMTRFPRHVFIGEVIPTGVCGPTPYRQEFIYSELHDSQKLLLDEAVMLHKRMVLQLRSFDFDLINNPVVANPLIHITPSFEKKGRLSERSVPYYYDLNNNFPFVSTAPITTGQLSAHWRYELARKCKTIGGVTQILAYGNQEVNQLIDQGPIKTPLRYDLDQTNFFRIEGHLGKSYVTVKQTIEDKKHQFDLPFNVVALRLQGAPFDEIEERCSFEDLRLEYSTTRASFICRLDNYCQRIAQQASPGQFWSTLITDANAVTGSSSVAFNPPASFSGDLGDVGIGGAGSTQRQAGTGNPAVVIVNRGKPLELLAQDFYNTADDLCTKLNLVKGLLPFDFKAFNYGADIAAIDDSFIKSWIEAVNLAIDAKAAFARVLDFIARSPKSRPAAEVYFALSQYAAEVIDMYNEIIQDCTYKEFEMLYYTYRYRLNYLQQNDPLLFSNFIRKHPGVDHKAGVAPGGTFIIVYNGDNVSINIQNIEQAVLFAENINDLECQRQVLMAKPMRSKEDNLVLANINFQLNQCFELEASLTSEAVFLNPSPTIQQILIQEDWVIADFALPYLCCCDCDCGDIPAPTLADLALPELNPLLAEGVTVPLFVQYNMGDYAFANPINTSMEGCTLNVVPLNIDVENHMRYDSTAGDNFVLKFIVNGEIRTPKPSTTSLIDTIITTQGGKAEIVSISSNIMRFRYTPYVGFVGVDRWQFMFEVYSGETKMLVSTPGEVAVHVMNQCTVVPPLESGDTLPPAEPTL